jgi:hypothetical protein
VKQLISKKILAILAGVVIVASGTVGFAVASGAIYLGPSIPKVTITGNGTTDVGISKTFGISVNGTPAYPLYFYWSSGHKVGTGTKFSTSFASPGTYNVSLLVSMDNNHTKTIVTAREIVNPDPTVTISENRNLIDAGQSISFSSSVSGGTGPYSYSWTYPGSSSADPTMQLYSDIGGVYVTVTDAAGYTVNSNVLNPTINSDPFVTASSNTTYTDVGSPVSFSASPYYGTTPYSYSWTWNGNVISTSQDFSYSFDQSGQQYVYVTLKDKLGETSTSYVVIEVERDPTVGISASPQNAPTGTDVSFLPLVNNGLAPFSYSWYVSGVYAGGDFGLYYTFNVAGDYNVEIIVTDAAGQTATATITETIT